MSYPNLIDPEVFAAEGQNLQGSFLLEELDERVSSHNYPADKQTRVSFTLQGGRDRLQRLFLDLNVKADMPLICQRCITPMPFLLDETSRIVLFADEESLDAAMLADEELEGMLLEKELDVRTLVEDQILMSLPFSPRHEDCGNNGTLEEVNRDKPNPFAVLAGLKSS
ncbi:Large ribosomal RNA subunit accumulation protein YceD [Neisseria subflava]|uniref:Large ribosomal RNA subunit accumulation protein YceD n=1 Tax=Neisseria subflava TaxID=28449 RepID=A0A9X9QXW6_NEISU|nr:YceD family protein [Neisseria subflava]VTY05684.1 Large ribosomal RNA subunit accumulation protein YceD [Neisseria subflava]